MQQVKCPHCDYEVGYLDEMAGQTFNCPGCGQKFQMPHLSEHIRVGVGEPVSRLREHHAIPRKRGIAIPKNPGVAAVLSFLFLGLGQIYNGQLAKGLLTYLVGAILAITGSVLFVPWMLIPVLWLWAIYDAYDYAENFNKTLP